VNIPSTLPVTYLRNDPAAATGESCVLFLFLEGFLFLLPFFLLLWMLFFLPAAKALQLGSHVYLSEASGRLW
jgi:hypothetical protein